MPSKNYSKTEEQTDLQQVVQHQIVNEQASDINPVLATLNQVFSTFQSRLQNQKPNPFEGAAKIAVDAFNDIVAGLKLKYPPDSAMLDAIAIAATTVELKWVDNTNNADGFKVKRCQKAESRQFSEFTVIAKLPATARVYRDNNLSSNTTYRYQLMAFNARGESLSNTVDITTK